MSDNKIKLVELDKNDKEQFILENQQAFKYGALEEFGMRDDHLEEDGEIISRATIEKSIEEGLAYRIIWEKEIVGGLIIKIEGEVGDLEILFIKPQYHSRGFGFEAWCRVEEMYPQVKRWITMTPYFEKRNIHFYVNKCGFHVVEFFNEHQDFGDMFRFEKEIKQERY